MRRGLNLTGSCEGRAKDRCTYRKAGIRYIVLALKEHTSYPNSPTAITTEDLSTFIMYIASKYEYLDVLNRKSLYMSIPWLRIFCRKKLRLTVWAHSGVRTAYICAQESTVHIPKTSSVFFVYDFHDTCSFTWPLHENKSVSQTCGK